MPEQVDLSEVAARYEELISESLLLVGTAIETCAKAQAMLERVRFDRVATAEQVSDAAKAYREAQRAMQEQIDDHVRLLKQKFDLKETRT